VPRGLQWNEVRALALLLGALTVCGCARGSAKTYPIHGQILAISSPRPDGRVEITLKHDDIRGFMPAMTMPYLVGSPGSGASVAGLTAGDVIDATLVVNGDDVHLQGLHKTGHAPLPAGATAVRIPDVMQPGDQVPDDALIDQTGATRKLSDWRGRALAFTFVYTRCPLPDFCPAMDRGFSALQKAIKEDPTLS